LNGAQFLLRPTAAENEKPPRMVARTLTARRNQTDRAFV
jgi:hypothetical protein